MTSPIRSHGSAPPKTLVAVEAPAAKIAAFIADEIDSTVGSFIH